MPSRLWVTANAGAELAALTITATTPASAAAPAPVPASSRGLVRRREPALGDSSCASSGPCSRTISRHNLSVNLLIVSLLLSQPGTCPGQPFAEHNA